MTASRRPLALLLAGAAALYSVCAWLGPGVGHINDDAHYILGAEALLEGSYTETLDPASPRPFPYPPGLPLFLAPFVASLRPHWEWLQAVSIALTVASGWLVFVLAETALAPGLGLAAAALWLFSPTTARLASPVMSEPLTAFLVLSALLWLRRLLASGRGSGEALAFGALLGYAMLVRYSAAVLALPLLAALWAAGRRRHAVLAAVSASAGPGAFALWLHARSGHLTPYDSAWRLSLSHLGDPSSLLDHGVRFLHTTFVYGLLGIELPYSAANVAVSLAVTAALLFPLTGLPAAASKDSEGERLLLAAAALFVGLWLALHAFWPYIGARFSFPAFAPFIILWLAGAREVARRSPAARHGRVWAIAVLGLLYPYRLVADARLTRARFRPPSRTLAWAKRNLPEDARVLAVTAAEWRLHSRRATVPSVPASDAASFRKGLAEAGVTHVAVQPLTLKLAAYAPRAPGPPPEWLRGLRVVHADPDEGTSILAVD